MTKKTAKKTAKKKKAEPDCVFLTLKVGVLRRKGETLDDIQKWLQNRLYDNSDVADAKILKAHDPKKPVYTCMRCGGQDVQAACWVSLNTSEEGEEFGTFNYDGNTFCYDCEEKDDAPHQKIKIAGDV